MHNSHVDLGREVHNLCLQDRALVIVEGPALHADRVRTHAGIGRGVSLEFERHHAGWVLDRVRGGQGEVLQLHAGGREVVFLAQVVVVLENGADEGLEGSGRLRVRGGLVLLDVHVAHQHDGPGAVAGHVVDVNTAPIRRGISREVSNALVARFGHAAERDGLLGVPGLAVEIRERHLRNVEVVALAGVQVADGVHVVLDECLHAWRALNSRETRGSRPSDQAAGALVPRGLALLVEVACEATSAAGAEGAVAHHDELIGRHLDVRVLGLDGRIVPGRDASAEDLREGACIQLQSRTTEVCGRNVVEDADGAEGEGQVHHRLGGGGRHEAVIVSLAHRDVTRAEVVVALSGAGGIADEFLLAGATADGAVRENHRHACALLHELHGLGEPILGVRGAAAVQLRGDATIASQARHCGLECQDLRSHDVALVVVERDALRADHISGHATNRIRFVLLDEARHARGVDDRGRRCQGLRLHRGGRGREAELFDDTCMVVENP
mmetsp:Transcript_67515/g.194045  ORF Transcript_67515/g.194045 Transcript_67515/m.194045 type:complete len:498 (+) Transcript_67515:368-1861(+)